ncbi:MAG: hypothetical protein GF329_06275, partial [Candidatus Lokiarchaeota archaeon]|nr:hypothetical protein [Candidatus Lokiarchaeota archaeon]
LEICKKIQTIKDLKYILIDEYQDFSKKFFQIIEAIKKYNPSVRFFCVGDDWQAINSFAGSVLEYFKNFKIYFPEARRISLLTNHRSGKNIIEYSNLLMKGLGEGAMPEDDKPEGEVHLLQFTYVEWRNNEENTREYENDDKYRRAALELMGRKNKKGFKIEISRYLKTIEKIIKDNMAKEICLLFRANEMYGVNIKNFKDKIQTICNKKIFCSTAHSYKGKESEVIIIVDANKKKYPKIHPDNELMKILGVTIQKVMDEERRLFYVALTRAKEKLYLIYENEFSISDFISQIENNKNNFFYRIIWPKLNNLDEFSNDLYEKEGLDLVDDNFQHDFLKEFYKNLLSCISDSEIELLSLKHGQNYEEYKFKKENINLIIRFFYRSKQGFITKAKPFFSEKNVNNQIELLSQIKNLIKK